MKLALSISTAAMCLFEAKPRNPFSGRISHGVYPESIRRVRDDSVRLPRRESSVFCQAVVTGLRRSNPERGFLPGDLAARLPSRWN
jgi:hypothetical protein